MGTTTRRRVAIFVGIVLLAALRPQLVHAEGVCYVTPQIRGCVRFYPEQSSLILAPGVLQSHYFRTTQMNREFRRMILEFQVPDYVTDLDRAILFLKESGGWISRPVPPDTHDVQFYGNADLALTTEDFSRPAAFIATFATDQNIPSQEFLLDVTGAVAHRGGQSIGIRVKLEDDPLQDAMTSLGSGFLVALPVLELSLPPGVTPCEPAITVQTVPEGTLVSWIPSAGAVDHDLAYGGLKSLKAYRSPAINQCGADDVAGTSVVFTPVPPVGDGFWFLVRDNDASSCRTYGGTPEQQPLRDSQITACTCQ